GEPHRPGRVQGLLLHGVPEPDAGARVVAVALEEGLGAVPEREHGLLDAMATEVLHDPLDHGPIEDRQHLLGRVERQRPEARPEPPDEDDRPHPPVADVPGAEVVGAAVVVVPSAGAVVVVPSVAVVLVVVGGASRSSGTSTLGGSWPGPRSLTSLMPASDG